MRLMIRVAPSRCGFQQFLPDSSSSILTRNRAAARTTSAPTEAILYIADGINCSAFCFAMRASITIDFGASRLSNEVGEIQHRAWLDICAAEAATITWCSKGCVAVNGRRVRNGLRPEKSWPTRSRQTRDETMMLLTRWPPPGQVEAVLTVVEISLMTRASVLIERIRKCAPDQRIREGIRVGAAIGLGIAHSRRSRLRSPGVRFGGFSSMEGSLHAGLPRVLTF